MLNDASWKHIKSRQKQLNVSELGGLGHEVVHAGLVRLVDVALLVIGADAANVRTLIEVVRVVTVLLYTLPYEPRRLDSVQHRHAVVHENEPVRCRL